MFRIFIGRLPFYANPAGFYYSAKYKHSTLMLPRQADDNRGRLAISLELRFKGEQMAILRYNYSWLRKEINSVRP